MISSAEEEGDGEEVEVSLTTSVDNTMARNLRISVPAHRLLLSDNEHLHPSKSYDAPQPAASQGGQRETCT